MLGRTVIHDFIDKHAGSLFDVQVTQQFIVKILCINANPTLLVLRIGVGAISSASNRC